MLSNDRATFLFRQGRAQRMLKEGRAPTEFFYGFYQLSHHGWQAEIIEDADIGMSAPLNLLARLVNKASRFLGGFPIGMSMALFRPGVRRRLDQAGVLVATTTGLGLVMAFGKAFGLLKRPVVLLAMGIMPMRPSSIQRVIIPYLLRRVFTVAISQGDKEVLEGFMPGHEVLYVPFGVDDEYWKPANKPDSGNYVLAIGNDPNRDWKTLIAAWSSDLPSLKIVTTLPVPAGPPNVEIIRGDWREQVLCDDEIRRLYQGACLVVVPVRETSQPSGQSVCLQAMACGKAVVLSEISGLWDRNLMVDRETVMLVPPANATALGNAIRELIADAALRKRVAMNGRRVIEENLNVDVMAEALAAVLERARG